MAAVSQVALKRLGDFGVLRPRGFGTADRTTGMAWTERVSDMEAFRALDLHGVKPGLVWKSSMRTGWMCGFGSASNCKHGYDEQRGPCRRVLLQPGETVMACMARQKQYD